ncbi:MAG: LPS export ABC transporter periplasmic protein LptC [Candidatus Binatia bacterium]|nr:LPS export ABC transporter periplasmic protein LptC [Candidatus Binatia bacterium]
MSLRAFHFLLAAVAILAAVLVVQLWRTVRAARSAAPLIAQLAPGVTQRARAFHRSQVKDGRTVWEVSAADVEYSQTHREASIRNVNLKWYLDERQWIGIRSNSGRLRLADGEIDSVEVAGDVEFSLGPYMLRIPSALYERSRETIVAPGPIHLAGGGLELTGSRLTVDLRLSTLFLEGEVHTVLHPNQVQREFPHAPL